MIRILNIFILLLSFTCLTVQAQSRFVLKADKSIVIESRKILYEQIGVRELTGNNDGAKIREYQNSVSIPMKSPYCAAGQYYCFLQAQKKVNKPIPIKRTGLANAIYADAANKGRETAYSANIDDLIIWKYDNSVSGHIERTIKVIGNGFIETIGFNTGTNARDGEGVKKCTRSLLHPLSRMRVRGLVGFDCDK